MSVTPEQFEKMEVGKTKVFLLDGFQTCVSCGANENFVATAKVGIQGTVYSTKLWADKCEVDFGKGIKGHSLDGKIPTKTGQTLCLDHVEIVSDFNIDDLFEIKVFKDLKKDFVKNYKKYGF